MADLNSEAFRTLLQAGKERGYLTYRQVNDSLEAEGGGDDVAAALVDQLLVAFEEQGIELLDEQEAAQRELPLANEPDAPAFTFKPDELTRALLEIALGPSGPEHPPVGDATMHRTFLEAVRESPEDDTLRLIYADWLEEHGSAQGEFVRVQCALARTDEDDPRWDVLKERERQLREAGWWEAPGPEGVLGWDYERGLIERARVTADWFLEHAKELFEWAPLRQLQLTAPRLSPEEVKKLAELPELARLIGLDLPRVGLRPADLVTLLSRPHLQNLTALNLQGNPLQTEAFRLLAEARSLPRLASLDLRDCGLSDGDVAVLLTAPFAGQLTDLQLAPSQYQRGVTDAGMRAVASAPLRQLRFLSIRLSPFTAEGVAALACSANLSRLAHLNLDAGLYGESPWACAGLAEALAGSPLASRLVTLELDGQNLGVSGMAALARSEMPRIRHLRLRWNELGDEGLKTLLVAPWAGNLRSLGLAGNNLGPDGLPALAKCNALPSLRHLDLSHNDLAREAAAILAGSPLLGRLTHLDLRYNALDPEAVGGLLASPHLSPRILLDLEGNPIRPAQLATLVQNNGGRPCRLQV